MVLEYYHLSSCDMPTTNDMIYGTTRSLQAAQLQYTHSSGGRSKGMSLIHTPCPWRAQILV